MQRGPRQPKKALAFAVWSCVCVSPAAAEHLRVGALEGPKTLSVYTRRRLQDNQFITVDVDIQVMMLLAARKPDNPL